MTLRLRPLRAEDRAGAELAHEELRADNFEFLLQWDPRMDWGAYVGRCAAHVRGEQLPERWVPSTFLLATVGEEIVGRVSIRHNVDNEFLLNYGGHIGYCVRPAYRREGHATEILGQALVVARAAGVDRVLVTCDENNVASRRVIEKRGGILEDSRTEPGGVVRLRFWID
ncbi:MAG TPA: GNAT family N-acetyltransferase [Solirubrobacteraceae bacterium]|nr:GNAT family N-acetyltransferase [Solirubrobacteraceae bacterium]